MREQRREKKEEVGDGDELDVPWRTAVLRCYETRSQSGPAIHESFIYGSLHLTHVCVCVCVCVCVLPLSVMVCVCYLRLTLTLLFFAFPSTSQPLCYISLCD